MALSAAVVAGALAGPIDAWLAHRSWSVSSVAFVCGGLAGFVVGRVVGRALYRTADGQTAVVRAGRGALPAALRAGLAGGLASAVASTGLGLWLLAAPPLPSLIAAACCGILAGVVLPCLASLTS